MRVLITGGTGLIGRQTAIALHARGHDVRVLSRRPRPDVPLLRGVPIEFVQGDVRDPRRLGAAFAGCDAAVLSHQFSNFPVEDPRREETFDAVDRRGTVHCVQSAQAAGVRRLVYVSGSALSAPNPEHPGIRAKRAAEQAVLDSGISALVLRVNVVYAADDPRFSRYARLVRAIPFAPIPGDGRSRCAPIPVEDVASAISAAVERAEVTGVISVCGAQEVNWCTFLLHLSRAATGAPRLAVHIPRWLLWLAGLLGERFPRPLFSRDAAVFIADFEQACSPPNCDVALGVHLTPLEIGLKRAFGSAPPALAGWRQV